MRGTSKGDSKEIKFDPGEACTELVLWGNGIGTRTGRIKIVTEKQTFEWGKNVKGQDSYPQDVGGGILMGFRGRASEDIDCLSSYFLKPINSIDVNVTYNKISDPTGGITSIQEGDEKYDNRDNSEPTDWTYSNKITKTVTNNWSQAATSSWGMGLKISAGVPEIAEVEQSFEWQISQTSEHGYSETSDCEVEWNMGGKLKAGEAIRVVSYYAQGNIRIQYDSTVVVTVKGVTVSSIKKGSSQNGKQSY
ncbi:uncharacterized protein PG998_010362 [Apiospora kogelbergensis]|uniref:uncharacterized protein n=1 Tax=Apiospora kogelbergensis TaxID=1337665 RepID=UPI00312FD5E2